jgi:simple sugar transport system ATP-binding protein
VAQAVAQAVEVSKRFGSTVALKNANLSVLPGEAHALVGRNGAGKSTLVSLLTGLAEPDNGEIRFDGKPAPAYGERRAWQSKVACVYQHSMVIPQLSVAENLFLNRYPVSATGAIAWRDLTQRARALLEEWQIEIAPNARAGSLGVEERQLVEIVRALSFGARFIILDEPTAHLDSAAIGRLFAHLRALKSAGVTLLFISHHLQEVYDLCDRVTVLRDAQWICTKAVAELPKDGLIEAMTGETGGLSVPQGAANRSKTAPVLDVDNAGGDGFSSVSFGIGSGEIAGLAGIGGSGKAEVAEALAGLARITAGEIRLDGKTLPNGNARTAIDAGVGFVPRDRHREGLVLSLSVAENATMTIDDRLGRAGFIQPSQRARAAQTLMDRLDVVASSPQQCVSELSGGNQQKVVFARALAREPKVLVLIQPTAGVDVKSKEALLRSLEPLRERGTAVLIVSDEIDDLRPCDRVYVMFSGRIVAQMQAGWRENDLVAQMEGVHARVDS